MAANQVRRIMPSFSLSTKLYRINLTLYLIMFPLLRNDLITQIQIYSKERMKCETNVYQIMLYGICTIACGRNRAVINK